MAKSIFEQMSGIYEQQVDYFIPCLTLSTEKEQQIGLFGQWHLRYLKQYRRVTYANLLTSGRLNDYLADIDKQAQGITEKLKADNQMEWVGRMNNIRACAMKIVNKEIIYA